MPSFASARAYWTVNMFNAALDILYAGVGEWYLGAMAMEPRVDVLDGLSATVEDYRKKMRGRGNIFVRVGNGSRKTDC
jgi:hypothetical protein